MGCTLMVTFDKRQWFSPLLKSRVLRTMWELLTRQKKISENNVYGTAHRTTLTTSTIQRWELERVIRHLDGGRISLGIKIRECIMLHSDEVRLIQVLRFL